MDTLQERHANWQGARELAANDPTIDLENNTHDVNPYSNDPEDYQEPETEVPTQTQIQEVQQPTPTENHEQGGGTPERQVLDTKDSPSTQR